MMFGSILKSAAAILVVSLICTVAIVYGLRANADDKPAKQGAKDANKLKTALKERLALAKEQYDTSKKGFTSLLKSPSYERPQGVTAIMLYMANVSASQDRLYEWAKRLLSAELESSDKKADRIAAYEANLKRMKELEELFSSRAKGGGIVRVAAEAKYHRLEAVIMLERAKGI